MWNPPKKNNNGKKQLHSCSQNCLFLINKLLISNKRQKISKKLGANFNTNTSKTTTCVSHHIYCASLTNRACARGGRALGENGAHALSFINSATQESWKEDKEEDAVGKRRRHWIIASQTWKREMSVVLNNTREQKWKKPKTQDMCKWCRDEGRHCERRGQGGKYRGKQSPRSSPPPSEPSTSFLGSSLVVKLGFFGLHFFPFPITIKPTKHNAPLPVLLHVGKKWWREKTWNNATLPSDEMKKRMPKAGARFIQVFPSQDFQTHFYL